MHHSPQTLRGNNENHELRFIVHFRSYTACGGFDEVQDQFFGVTQAEKARQSLLLEGLKLSCSEEDASSSEGDSPPMKKRAGNGMSVHESFWDCFNEVAKDNNQTEDSDNSAIANELDFFLKMLYDLECANVSEQRFYNTLTKEHREAWRCVLCKSRHPKADNSNTPVRGGADGITIQRGAAVRSPTQLNMSIVEQPSSLNDTAHNMTIEVSDFQAFVMEMRSFRQEMLEELRSNRLKIEQLGETVISLSDKIIESSVESLKVELNDRDQDLLLNDVEISCIQEQRGEGLLHVVTVLAGKLGVNLAAQDVVCATRVGRAPESGEAEKSLTSRPRPIVVRLARRVVRDELLQAARVRRGATTDGTGLPGTPRRFYVNERLTKVNRHLFRRMRELCGRLNWRYVWTKDGRIFVRQFQGREAPRLRIRVESDLVRVFGREAVSATSKNEPFKTS
ncbi:unnamed protein product [Diatraea saccharalis]|uniref:FP protein C-terminal domain-containing protein n=1 Tax=Diatraea saccharalis TaxID=40085 RepID=A0A9N9N1K9_9NEOP|nr:unnamed protein product [Diatraea saccharalis]